MELTLVYKGLDSWSRPVYSDDNGRLWKDVDPRSHRNPDLCTVMYNSFDGEPDTPMNVMERYEDCKINFIPSRVTWG